MAEGKTIRDVARDLGDLGRIYREDVEEGRRADIAKFLERRNVMNVGVVTALLLWLLSVDLPPARLGELPQGHREFLGSAGGVRLQCQELRGTVRRPDSEAGGRVSW